MPLVLRARSSGGLGVPLATGHALLFVLLFWRHPVPALWVFLLPNLLGRGRRVWVTAIAALPFIALAGLGIVAWSRGFVRGLWLAPWEIAVLAFGLACAFALGGGSSRRASAPRGGGKGKRKRGR